MILSQQIVADIETLIANTPERIRITVWGSVDQNAQALASQFYDAMLQNELASTYLNHEIVKERLHASLMRWLRDVYHHPHQELSAFVATQRHVGEVHSRIHLPFHLVTRGARVLKFHAYSLLESLISNNDELGIAFRYVSQMMDMALELMSAAYERNAERESRTDEAYRQHSIGQNMSAERERQRSNLLEWGRSVLVSLYRQSKLGTLPRIVSSEFGLWLTHKGGSMFEGSPELAEIRKSMERLDDTILSQLQSEVLQSKSSIALLGELEAEIESIKYQLASLFDRQLEVENGRDTLTRLFNRRFLPSVMSREIAIANKQKERFALVLVDIDHFKQVNDTYGHEAGDLVLQQTASLILNTVRSGDFVFRYGGEELLILLVDITPESAKRVAEKLCKIVEQTPFSIDKGQLLSITISLGVSVFDGHPDYQYLIRRADEAMYQAKHGGRNQVCVA